MKKAVAELFSSKKFLVMITAIIAYVLARVGWDVDPKQIDTIMQVVAGYLVGQGIADHGKEAAKVTAAASLEGEGESTADGIATSPKV